MYWIDVVPGLSLIKSTGQMLTGDFEGAGRTTRNFWTKSPGFSHVFGAVAGTVGIVANDQACKDLAVESFNGGNQTASDWLDAIPVVGETKGLIHLLLGDTDGAKKAFTSPKFFVHTARDF